MDNDMGIKLLELQDRIYLSIITEFNKCAIPPMLGKMVVDGVAARISQDATSIFASQVVHLQEELSDKEKEIPKKPEGKQASSKANTENGQPFSGSKERGSKL